MPTLRITAPTETPEVVLRETARVLTRTCRDHLDTSQVLVEFALAHDKDASFMNGWPIHHDDHPLTVHFTVSSRRPVSVLRPLLEDLAAVLEDQLGSTVIFNTLLVEESLSGTISQTDGGEDGGS